MALLEYGEYYKSVSGSEGDKSKGDGKGNKKGGQLDDEEDEKKREELRKEMTQYTSSGRVNQDVLGGLISSDLEEVLHLPVDLPKRDR